MKLSLSANITRLRKEHSMTQEQLAEALGVTFASVSKWERGVATPELHLIAEMADLFEVSLDALIGYQFRNNDRQNVIVRLKQYFHDRSNEDIYTDIEKSLQRYPNCFEVVYYSARIYHVRGFVQNNTEYLRRALSLYQHVCLLIGQNTDLDISEISIYNEIAGVYLTLGEYDKGLKILKQYNPCQINHPVIGQTLASACNDPEGALPYLSIALLNLTQTHIQIVMGYINVYRKTNHYQDALLLVDWALTFYPGLRVPEKRSYMDKSEAILWAARAQILLSLNKKEDALNSLRQAKAIALQFDQAPDYDASSIRFVSCQKPATAFDDIGDTAMIGLDSMIAQYEKQELIDLWRMVKDEA